ncbi:MAG TPA: choice-of-anchor D domain-containing protein [Solirubrobacteraceae bacterium]|nr:choice-of-anchor D domain-containing protein [Solirubrobacteraceae bacterium]
MSPTTDGLGLPTWYDDGAQQLTLCDDGSAECALLTPADFTAPDGEAFYNRAVAKMDGPNGELMTLVLATEAAFDPTFTNTPVTFDRVRSKIVGGAPNSTYTVEQPFGTQTVTTDAGGVGVTTDQVGCVPPDAATPCDFSVALTGSLGPWIRWDSGAPAGYVGDPTIDHKITGSPLIPAQNFFRMTGANLGGGTTPGSVETDLFSVTGKIFDPTVAAFGSSPVSFGGQRVGTTSTTHNAVIRNDGGAAMTINGVTVSGANAGDYQIASNGCTTVAAGGGTCTVGVTFSPSAAGVRNAALTIDDDAPGNPHVVNLSGTGTQSVLAASPSGVAYGNQAINLTTAPRTVDVANNGSASLNVSGVTVGGANPGDFAIGVNTCGAAVSPGGHCSIDVSFTPGAAGVRTATLSLASDGGAGSVSLAGNGVATAQNAAGTGTTTQTTVTLGAPLSAIAGETAGSAKPTLALKSLSTAARVKQSKAKKLGIRLTMGLASGTEIVKVNVYRKSGTTLRLLSSGFKVTSSAVPFRVSQSQPALRRLLRRGSYEVQVTPGYSKTELGTVKKVAFKVV